MIEDDGTGSTQVKHQVDYTKPRGDLVCVYSRAKWSQDGFDFLDFKEATEVDVIFLATVLGQFEYKAEVSNAARDWVSFGSWRTLY